MPRTPSIFGLILLGSLSISDCGTEVCACELVISPAFVRGTVLRDDSSPVAQAQVHAYSAPGQGCSSLDEDFGFVATLPNGSYTMGLPSSANQDDVCVFVFGRPPEGASALGDSDTVLVVLDFHQDGREDSARVNLVLPSQ